MLVLSRVLGGKSPKGVGKEQDTLLLAPFVLSLSKGECREFRHPVSLFSPPFMPNAWSYLAEFK